MNVKYTICCTHVDTGRDKKICTITLSYLATVKLQNMSFHLKTVQNVIVSMRIRLMPGKKPEFLEDSVLE